MKNTLLNLFMKYNRMNKEVKIIQLRWIKIDDHWIRQWTFFTNNDKDVFYIKSK